MAELPTEQTLIKLLLEEYSLIWVYTMYTGVSGFSSFGYLNCLLGTRVTSLIFCHHPLIHLSRSSAILDVKILWNFGILPRDKLQFFHFLSETVMVLAWHQLYLVYQSEQLVQKSSSRRLNKFKSFKKLGVE